MRWASHRRHTHDVRLRVVRGRGEGRPKGTALELGKFSALFPYLQAMRPNFSYRAIGPALSGPLRVVAFGSAIVSIGACSSGDGAGGNTSVSSPESFARAFAEVTCNEQRACLGEFVERRFGDDCVESVSLSLVDDRIANLEDLLADGSVRFESTNASKCVDSARGAGCDAGAKLSAACDDVFTGTVSPGGACVASEQCVGSAYCQVLMECPGTCVERVALGGSCGLSARCERGLDCFSGTCVQAGTNGASCGGGTQADCGSGLRCIGEEDGVAGTCGTLSLVQGLGQDCGPEAFCQKGLHCAISVENNEPVSKCVAGAASGGTCMGAVPDMCPLDEYCERPGTTLEGTCRPRASVGAACESDEACLGAAVCVGGECVLPGRIGDQCLNSAQCYSEYCDLGKCAVLSLCE